MRKAFFSALAELADADPRVVLLTGDLGFMAVEPFAERHPGRFINAGVAEQNMVGMATGLAEAGYVPFVYSIATFAALRSYEFIRNGPVLHDLPVRIVGVGPGLDYGPNGITHWALEDVAVLRPLPGLAVIAPADDPQTASAVAATAGLSGPAYLRLARTGPAIAGLDGRFAVGRAHVLGDGADIALVALGNMASTAVETQGLLAASGVDARVVIVSCVRPAPTHDLVSALAGVPLAITIESHYVDGGLGSLTAEVVAENGLGARLVRAGIRRSPAGETGSAEFLLDRHGLSATALAGTAIDHLARRPRPLRQARMRPGDRIRSLQGPILVLGASGFVGANLTRSLLEHRADVVATTSRTPAWRLEDLPARNVREFDALVSLNVDRMLDEVQPRTIFNCIAYGAYSFETDGELILRTNLMSTHALLERLTTRNIAAYIHAGSSSEYGENAAGPEEHDFLAVNSEYAVSKAACAHLIHYYGKQHGLPSANLRLYSVYGPLEDPSRLMPKIVQHGVRGELPPLVDPHIARDFVYSDDVVDAFIAAASELREDDYGDSFNVGTGRQTTIGELAEVARELYGIEQPATFTMPPRRWDVGDWFANSARAQKVLGWEAHTPLEDGLERMTSWYRGLPNPERYRSTTKEVALDAEHSITAVVACYRDGEAIPVMYQRLTDTFRKLGVDYEIIFVNDASPDDSESVIREISERDRHVLGISHSRNFGSQAAFRSGMELATKNAVVLLDGDLQDPPELIEEFVERWKAGYDVVYGRRVKREATWFMQRAYRAFYWAFDRFSYLTIPRDAGDFSLIDRRVVHAMLQCDERDLFLRGVRAFVGFKQTGVDYVRPKRMFGETTNSLRRNIGWAKKGIFSFSNVPLTMLSFAGTVLFLLSLVLAAAQGVARVLAPDSAPRGIATVVILVLLFGSLNLFAIGLVGEYLARVFEEVKRRPLYVRSSIVRDGEVRLVSPSVDARSASQP